VDPITGERRGGPDGETETFNLPSPKGEHLCEAGEQVVFACPIEADEHERNGMTSVCIENGPRGKAPVANVRERMGGRVGNPFAKSTVAATISTIKAGNPPVAVGFEFRSNQAIYMVLKKAADATTDQNARPTYIRMLTVGPIETTRGQEGRCDPHRSASITDNIDRFVTLLE
jgi:hypothetical protein